MLKPASLRNAAEYHEDEERDARVEQHHQHAELLQRADAVLAHREGDGAEDAERREPDDEADDLEQDLGDAPDAVGQGLAALAQERETGAEQDRDDEDLEDVALGEGVHQRGRDELHQEVDRPGDLTDPVGVAGDRFRVQARHVDVHAVARCEDVGQNPDRARGRGS